MIAEWYGLLVQRLYWLKRIHTAKSFRDTSIWAELADRPSEYRWSSFGCYIGKEKKPAWLTSETVLGYFGQDDSSAQDNYRKFVEESSKSETKNLLKDVFASPFLGSPEFITWAKEQLIDPKNADKGNIPVFRVSLLTILH